MRFKRSSIAVAVVLAAMLTATAAVTSMVSCAGDKETPTETVSGTSDLSDATQDPAGSDTDDVTAPADTDHDTESGAPDEIETPAESDTTGPTEPGIDPGLVENDERVNIRFNDDFTAQVVVLESRVVAVNTSSDRLIIRGEGEFTVQYEGADGLVTISSVDGTVTLENTAAPHMAMEFTVTVKAKSLLTVTLDFDLGDENNPYLVETEGSTTVTFQKSVSVRIQVAGWYRLEGAAVEVTNYALEDGTVFLPVGVHGISTQTSGDVTVTLTLMESPAGYNESDPLPIPGVDEPATLKLFSGAELYYSFTATESREYILSMGAGKGQNCCFSLNTDGYTTYYGRYSSEEGEWLTCAGGLTATVLLSEGQTVIIKVEYSRGAGLIGNDDVSFTVTAGEAIETIPVDVLDDMIEGQLTAGGMVVYSFTASEAGVYEVNLGAGATNRNCRFTTSLDASGTYYVSGDVKRMRLSAGETMLITVDSGSGAEGRVSILMSRVAKETLPAEGWASGTYEGNGVMLVLDRDAERWSMGTGSGKLTYLDGQATFTIAADGGSMEYTLRMAENGVDMILSYVKDEETKEITLVYQAPVDPVNISLWKGVYTSATTKLVIYDDGSGLWGTTRYSITDNGCSYDTERNILSWYTYTMKIVEQDAQGRVTKISASVRGEEDPILFTLTDEAVVRLPDLLPIEVDERYEGGDGYDLFYQGSYQYFNDRVFTIIGHPAADQYVIAGYDQTEEHEAATYRLVFGEEQVVVYNEEDVEVAVLTPVRPAEIPDFKADGTAEASVAVDGEGRYYLKASATGWYTFMPVSDDYTEVFSDCAVSDKGKPSANAEVKSLLSSSGLTLKLTQGTVIGIYGGSVKVTYSETEPKAPLGYAANNPFIAEGQLYDAGWLTTTDVIYVQFTASETGTYQIGSDFDKIHLLINGAEYGKYYDDANWRYVECENGRVCTLAMSAGETVVVALNRLSQVWDTPDAIKLGFAREGELDALLGLTVEAASFNASQQGTYAGLWDKAQITLTVKKDSIDITYFFDNDWDGTNDTTDTVTGITTTVNGSNYTAKVELPESEEEWNIVFSFSDGNVRFTINGGDSITLSVGGGELPGGEDYFTEEQKGTYTSDDIQLTINADGSINFTDGAGNSVETVFPELNRGAYVFKCNGMNIIFQFQEDGSVKLRWNGEEVLLFK